MWDSVCMLAAQCCQILTNAISQGIKHPVAWHSHMYTPQYQSKLMVYLKESNTQYPGNISATHHPSINPN